MAKIKNTLPDKKTSKLVIILLIIAIVAVGAWYFINQRQSSSNAKSETNTSDTTDYSPPTKEEQEAGDKQKEANQQEENKDGTTPVPQDAKLVLVDASQYVDTIEVRAYVANAYEDGGTCTATFTRAGATTVSKTSQGFKDATTTQCRTINIPRSEFNVAGDWNLQITYTSDSISGQTASQTVTIK